METQRSRFDVEWWVIQKRAIYKVVAAAIAILLIGGASLYVWLYGNPFRGALDQVGAPSGARFVSFDGEVRVVSAQTRETTPARGDMRLQPGDIVQTGADGRARIVFADGSTLTVRENSVMRIRDNTGGGEAGGAARVRVAVDRGQVNIRTEQMPDGATNIVETRLTENSLDSQTDARFGVREDNSEDIRVSTGQIATTTRGGEHTIVRAGEFVGINQMGTVARRERLLDVPTPVTPRDLERVSIGENGAANILLRWQRPQSGTPAYYRVEVATSPFFVAAGRVIDRDQLAATELNVGDLRPGDYFWHVRAIAPSGQASEWSDPLKFTVAGTGTGERVIVSDTNVEPVAGSVFIVRGRSAPGNTIRVGNRETVTRSDGGFQIQITAPTGAREILIEAEDSRGNRDRYRLAMPRR
jgi:hypothetical protein